MASANVLAANRLQTKQICRYGTERREERNIVVLVNNGFNNHF